MSPLIVAAWFCIPLAGWIDAEPDSSIAGKTRGFERIEGFLPLYWDPKEGRLFIEVQADRGEFLYQTALATGVGSNPIGLDRGKLGDSRVVVFRRIGPRILLIEPNQGFRAETDRPAERRAVEQSFAQSVHGGFPIEAEEGYRWLIDATTFLLRDVQGVTETLKKSGQGTFRLDRDRSVIDPDRLKGFPRNTEIETLLTFASEGETGPLVTQTTPSPQSISIRQRHSFIELPERRTGYRPRLADPRVGVFAIDFQDHATPFDQPVEKRWICRHRLIKANPEEEVSEPIEPIVYYVDPGAPEPIRGALVEGASWWASAFEAAGFKNAFRVMVLPDDADPMDLRYNVIQWVHRSTRGWSYGNTVLDPRTGEILKGRVTLDSLRARQDVLIGTGLVDQSAPVNRCDAGLGPIVEELAPLDPNQTVSEMVLARIRQLSAHEVGHTLGFSHNFAASTNDRASVMDYPAPLVTINEGRLDLSNAYARGIGVYDIMAVKYAYMPTPAGRDETAFLDGILQEGIDGGLRFLSDADARPEGAAHPLANLWDNGPDPIAGLRHEMEVRRIAIEQFGLPRLRDGQPMADLQRAFLPVYLHHRYQLVAALKSLGGVDYSHSILRGNRPSPEQVAEIVPATRQRDALKAALETIRPDVLSIPERLLALIPPNTADRARGTAEYFPGETSPTFDPVACATVAADLAVAGLLQPQRAARLEEQHARDPRNPGFHEVVRELVNSTWNSPEPRNSRLQGVTAAVQMVVVQRLMRLAANDNAGAGARAIATDRLESMAQQLNQSGDIWRRTAGAEIRRFLSRPDAPNRWSNPLPTPPGDPIGAR